MSEHEGIHHRLEDRAPLPGEWSPDLCNIATYTDNRDCFEARLGNFLRNCCRVWHPAYMHHKDLTGQHELCGPFFSQSSVLCDQLRDNAIRLLEDLESNKAGEAENG